MVYLKCPICDADVDCVDLENGRIESCHACGTELEYQNGELVEFVQEGEDWGE